MAVCALGKGFMVLMISMVYKNRSISIMCKLWKEKRDNFHKWKMEIYDDEFA